MLLSRIKFLRAHRICRILKEPWRESSEDVQTGYFAPISCFRNLWSDFKLFEAWIYSWSVSFTFHFRINLWKASTMLKLEFKASVPSSKMVPVRPSSVRQKVPPKPWTLKKQKPIFLKLYEARLCFYRHFPQTHWLILKLFRHTNKHLGELTSRFDQNEIVKRSSEMSNSERLSRWRFEQI